MVQPDKSEFSLPLTTIPILRGCMNYVAWSRAVTTMLYGSGLWRYVCDDRVIDANSLVSPELEPAYMPIMPAYGTVATAAQLSAHAKWVRGDTTALQIITSRLDNSISHLIPGPFGPHGQTTARDAWAILNQTYNSCTHSHTSLIIDTLKCTCLGTDFDHYLATWNEGRTKLYNAGKALSEEDSIRGFIDGLPRDVPDWCQFILRTLDHLDDHVSNLSFMEVTECVQRVASLLSIWAGDKCPIYTNID